MGLLDTGCVCVSTEGFKLCWLSYSSGLLSHPVQQFLVPEQTFVTWTRSGVTVQVDHTTGVWCWGREQVRGSVPGQSGPAWITSPCRWGVDCPICWVTAAVFWAALTRQYRYIRRRRSLEKECDTSWLGSTDDILYYRIFHQNIQIVWHDFM